MDIRRRARQPSTNGHTTSGASQRTRQGYLLIDRSTALSEALASARLSTVTKSVDRFVIVNCQLVRQHNVEKEMGLKKHGEIRTTASLPASHIEHAKLTGHAVAPTRLEMFERARSKIRFARAASAGRLLLREQPKQAGTKQAAAKHVPAMLAQQMQLVLARQKCATKPPCSDAFGFQKTSKTWRLNVAIFTKRYSHSKKTPKA
ncbi:hypothetical protein M514_06972 [Trichuris suis]|uniref:Uncharacterized protein n=1 Tax=Trichuris suis TaxID=68888 RepID=A0A085N6Q4_9BILA|nr:hypothetical protein M513_06972 [Trichuris suis]KFD65150.1 hypothetical protein M514_06972 [Trichuris suis]